MNPPVDMGMGVSSMEEAQKEPTWCVPSAIFCAWAWAVKRKQEVRMAVYKLPNTTDQHVQAEAKMEGVWTPLTEIWTGESMAVIPFRQHYPDLKAYRHLSLKDWIDEQLPLTYNF